MKLIVLVICNYDGDRYKIFTDLDKANAAFEEATLEENVSIGDYWLYLVEAELDAEFGLDPRGGTYGCVLIREKDLES